MTEEDKEYKKSLTDIYTTKLYLGLRKYFGVDPIITDKLKNCYYLIYHNSFMHNCPFKNVLRLGANTWVLVILEQSFSLEDFEGTEYEFLFD